MQSSKEPGTSRAEPTSHVPDGFSLISGTLQSSPATTSPSGSLSGSQDDSDSDMAFSVNQSSSASESSLGKDVWPLGGAGRWAALVAVPALPDLAPSPASSPGGRRKMTTFLHISFSDFHSFSKNRCVIQTKVVTIASPYFF